MIDVVDTLQRIAAEAESIGCQCPEGPLARFVRSRF